MMMMIIKMSSQWLKDWRGGDGGAEKQAFKASVCVRVCVCSQHAHLPELAIINEPFFLLSPPQHWARYLQWSATTFTETIPVRNSAHG